MQNIVCLLFKIFWGFYFEIINVSFSSVEFTSSATPRILASRVVFLTGVNDKKTIP